MDKLIPALILIGIIILGFITKIIYLRNITKRTEFTNNYRSKFIKMIKEIMLENYFDQQLYYDLTLEVKSMQYELGSDGIIAHVNDPLQRLSTKNYQLLINFLPELRDSINELDNFIIKNRIIQSAHSCDDMFIRHLGTLKKTENSIRKNLFNPLSCFSEGIKFIVSSPLVLLHCFGFISDKTIQSAKHNRVTNFLNILITIVGFIGNLISIFMGWHEFWQIICNIF